MVIGFFMPLPLAMMIPFMGIQSMVMAKQFGENFQYGKRRISAMSNDEFNKLTPAKLLSNANAELRSQIPLMKESMEDMRQFQVFIVKEFLLTIRSIIDAGLGKLIGLTPTEINQTVQNIEHFLHGHFEGHGPGGTLSPDVGDPDVQRPFQASLTFEEIRAMSDNELSHFINNISRYDVKTQNILTQEQQRRNRIKPPTTPGVPIDTLKPKGDRPFLTSGPLSRLVVNAINNYIGAGRYKNAFTTLAALYGNAVKTIEQNRSPTSVSNAKKVKIAVTDFILKLNKYLGI